MLLVDWFLSALIVAALLVSILGYWFFWAKISVQTKLVSYSEHSFSLLSLVFALGVFCNLSLLLGLAGGYNILMQTILVGLGVFFFFSKSKKLQFDPVLPKLKPYWWLLLLPGLYFLVRIVTSGLPLQHSDALYYHLAAPKLWASLGQVRLVEEHPSYALTGIWETVYGIPQLWAGIKGVRAHLISQISAQWLHVIVGQVLSVLIASKLLSIFVPKSKKYLSVRLFFGWLCTCVPGLEWQGGLAKNDYILLVFSLAAVLATVRKETLLAGVFVGFSYATKTLGAWLGVSLVLYFLVQKFTDKKTKLGNILVMYFTGALAGVFVFVLRNLIWTKNPIFPNLDGVFGPGWLSHWWADYLKAFGGKLTYDPAMWSWVWTQMLHKALPKSLVFLGLLATLAIVIKNKLSLKNILSHFERSLFQLLPTLIFLFGFAFLMLRPIADGRYAGYVIVLWLVFFVSFLLTWFFSQTKRIQKVFTALFLPLGFLITIPAEQLIKVPKNYLFTDQTKYLREYHPGYDFKEWMHKNTDPNAVLVCMAEKVNFYLDRQFEAASEMRKWEVLLSQFQSAKDFVLGIRKLGYRYVHITPGQILPSQMEPYWEDLMALLTKAAFQAEGSIIFDLEKL